MRRKRCLPWQKRDPLHPNPKFHNPVSSHHIIFKNTVMMELYLKTLLSTYGSDEVVIVFDNARRNSRASRIESSSSNAWSSSSHQPQEVSRKRDRWSRELQRHMSDSCLEIPNRNSKKNGGEDRLSSSAHDYPRTSSNGDIYGTHHGHVSVGSPRRNRNMRWRMDEAYSPRSPEEEQNSIYSIRKVSIKEDQQPIREMSRTNSKDIALHVPMRLMSPAAHQAIGKVGSIRLQHHQRAMLDIEPHAPMRFHSPQSARPTTVSKNVRRKVQVKKRLSDLDDSTHIQRERMDPHRRPKCAALAARREIWMDPSERSP